MFSYALDPITLAQVHTAFDLRELVVFVFGVIKRPAAIIIIVAQVSFGLP